MKSFDQNLQELLRARAQDPENPEWTQRVCALLERSAKVEDLPQLLPEGFREVPKFHEASTFPALFEDLIVLNYQPIPHYSYGFQVWNRRNQRIQRLIILDRIVSRLGLKRTHIRARLDTLKILKHQAPEHFISEYQVETWNKDDIYLLQQDWPGLALDEAFPEVPNEFKPSTTCTKPPSSVTITSIQAAAEYASAVTRSP